MLLSRCTRGGLCVPYRLGSTREAVITTKACSFLSFGLSREVIQGGISAAAGKTCSSGAVCSNPNQPPPLSAEVELHTAYQCDNQAFLREYERAIPDFSCGGGVVEPGNDIQPRQSIGWLSCTARASLFIMRISC